MLWEAAFDLTYTRNTGLYSVASVKVLVNWLKYCFTWLEIQCSKNLLMAVRTYSGAPPRVLSLIRSTPSRTQLNQEHPLTYSA